MDDLISRQAAIELIERMKPYQQNADDIAEMIANMPSAQPDTDRIYAELSKAYNVEGLPDEAIGIIGDLMLSLDEPSVQPKSEERTAESAQNVPNDELISKKAAIEALEWTWAGKAAFDAIKNLPSAQPDNSCDGCRYENADDGVLVPCGFCKRSHPDNYERRTDG